MARICRQGHSHGDPKKALKMMEVRVVPCDWLGNCFLSRSTLTKKNILGSLNKMDMVYPVCRCRIAGMCIVRRHASFHESRGFSGSM